MIILEVPRSPQSLQYGTERSELEMANLGCDNLLRSMLALALLRHSGDLWAGSAPVEGKAASGSRSDRK